MTSQSVRFEQGLSSNPFKELGWVGDEPAAVGSGGINAPIPSGFDAAHGVESAAARAHAAAPGANNEADILSRMRAASGGGGSSGGGGGGRGGGSAAVDDFESDVLRRMMAAGQSSSVSAAAGSAQ
jgi:hypothetical protein